MPKKLWPSILMLLSVSALVFSIVALGLWTVPSPLAELPRPWGSGLSGAAFGVQSPPEGTGQGGAAPNPAPHLSEEPVNGNAVVTAATAGPRDVYALDAWESPPARSGERIPTAFSQPDTCETDRVLRLESPLMTGDDVREVQEGLIALGFQAVRANGTYGPETYAAVREFQQRSGIPETGAVDSRTLDAMAEQYLATAMSAGSDNPSGNGDSTWQPPPDPEGIALVVDTDARVLLVMRGTTVLKQYRVAVGKDESPTPHGDWFIRQKAAWSGGFGTRWMRLSVPWGVYGLHGTNKPWSVGSFASHGCIRMLNRDVEEVFKMVSLGTPIRVVGRPEDNFGEVQRVIGPTAVGSDVLALQYRLIELGYDPGVPDGVYGGNTLKALGQFQKEKGLKVNSIIDRTTWEALDLW